MAHALPTWHEPEAVLSLARSASPSARASAGPTSPSASPGSPAPTESASSTCPASTSPPPTIRRRVAAGRPIRYLVPDAVAAYIDTAELYR